MKVWKRLEKALARSLAALTIDQCVTIGTKEGNRFVQIGKWCECGLRAEAASNRVLEANERLDVTALDRLDALGWHRPASDDIDDPQGGCRNHWFQYEMPVPFETVAEQAVRTLRDVYRVQHPNELAYAAFDVDGPGILLPELGLELDASAWPEAAGRDAALDPPELQKRVAQELDDAFDDVTVLDDCRVQVRFGSAAVFVRVVDDPPVIHVFSPIVADVTDGPLLVHKLNERNLGVRFVRYLVADSTLIASHELFGRPFVPAHLVYAVNVIGELAGTIDDEFSSRFGGHVFFHED